MIKTIALSLLALGFVSTCFAAAPAADNASNPPYNGTTWPNGSNGGTGFGPWTQSTSNANNAGFFVGDSSGNGGTGNIGTAFGLFGNSGATASANRSFTAGGTSNTTTLDPTQTFSLQMDNGNVTGSVGFNLFNATGVDRFTFEFIGGRTDYVFNNGTQNNVDTGIAFTKNGLTISFTQGVNNAFSLTVSANGGSSASFTGTLGASDITQFQLFNVNAGSGGTNDLFFNNMSVSAPAAVPEPSSLSLIAGPAILGAYFFVRRRRAA